MEKGRVSTRVTAVSVHGEPKQHKCIQRVHMNGSWKMCKNWFPITK